MAGCRLGSVRLRRERASAWSTCLLYCAVRQSSYCTASTPGHRLIKSRPRKSRVIKRSIVVEGQKTSVSLEAEFWAALKEIAAKQSAPIGTLVATINSDRNNRQQSNLSSAVRVFVLEHYRARAKRRAPKAT
jgi:predicted DNA-binding ribbon-helix-helix protein